MAHPRRLLRILAPTALVHLGNCSLRCSRPLFQTRLYLLRPWSRTIRHPWRSRARREAQGFFARMARPSTAALCVPYSWRRSAKWVLTLTPYGAPSHRKALGKRPNGAQTGMSAPAPPREGSRVGARGSQSRGCEGDFAPSGSALMYRDVRMHGSRGDARLGQAFRYSARAKSLLPSLCSRH
jgi:hypothetical protein